MVTASRRINRPQRIKLVGAGTHNLVFVAAEELIPSSHLEREMREAIAESHAAPNPDFCPQRLSLVLQRGFVILGCKFLVVRIKQWLVPTVDELIKGSHNGHCSWLI